MFATKQYYENKIAFYESKASKLDEIKSFIEDLKLIKYRPSADYVMEEITKIIEKK